MAEVDLEADPPGWGQPLGSGLPLPGAPQIPWKWLSIAALVALGAVGGAGCLAFPYVFPQLVLGAAVSQHANLRDAALAWRAELARDPTSAAALQIWQRGVVQTSCCRPAVVTDTEPGDFLVVRPVAEAGAGAEVAQAARIVTKARAVYTPTLKLLAPQLQRASLGAERLGRGAAIVELQPTQAGAPLRVVSGDTPPEGYPAGGVSVAPLGSCLPLLGDTYQNASLASPEGQGIEGARYWLARTRNAVALLKVGACGAKGSEPIEVRSFPVAGDVTALLTFAGKPGGEPHLMLLPSEGSQAAPTLLRAPAVNPTALDVLGTIDSKGINQPGGAAVAAAELFDAFQVGLPGTSPDDLRVAVRRVSGGETQYLVKADSGFVWDRCPSPAPSRYLVVADTCALKAGQYLAFGSMDIDKLSACREVDEPQDGAFELSLGSGSGKRRSRTECVAKSAYVHPEYADLGCDLLVTSARCVGGEAEK
jgi:hypothetical protein